MPRHVVLRHCKSVYAGYLIKINPFNPAVPEIRAEPQKIQYTKLARICMDSKFNN